MFVIGKVCVKRSGRRCLATVSSLFQPVNLPPKDSAKEEWTCKSQRLLNEMGYIKQASPGMTTLLPLGTRVLSKLKKLISTKMSGIGCQQVLLPMLTADSLWKKTGRWESTGSELFTVTDRHDRQYALSPTHEEAITELVASCSLTYRQLPVRLYQIGSKFRDEIKPRLGLLRGREFIMKDLYTFDTDINSARETYSSVCRAYDEIFQELAVDFIKVGAATGNIGGLTSHEYQYPTAIGEDRLNICPVCNFGANLELGTSTCPNHPQTPMVEAKGIEIAHTFLLGTKYSSTLGAKFTSSKGQPAVIEMGCYGIGVSRLLAASVQVLSSEKEIRWPKAIAPFSVCILAPKAGSKEESATPFVQYLAGELCSMARFSDEDVIIDDRNSVTIGKKLMEARRTGYPYVVVVGRKSTAAVPLFELHDVHKNVVVEMNAVDILNYLAKC